MTSPLLHRSRGRSLLLPVVAVVVVVVGLFFILDDDQPVEDELQGLQSPLAETDDDRAMRLGAGGQGDSARPLGSAERLDTPERETGDRAVQAPYADVAIVGRITDVEGEGLADVDVSLYDAQGDFLDVVGTEEDGSYAFESDEPLGAGFVVSTDGDLFADSSDPDAQARVAHRHTETWRPGDAPVEIDLVITRAPMIEGRVTLASTGEPVFLADIEIVVGGAAFAEDYQDDWTDELGNFAIALIEIPHENVLVRVTDDDAVAMVGPFDLQPGERRWLDIELHDPVTLEGIVRSANDGAPLPDVEVNVLPLHPAFDTSNDWDVTFDDGTFLLEDVAMPADRLWLLASDMEHAPVMVQVTRPDLPVEIRMGPLVRLHGHVRDSATGEPIDDYEIQVLLDGPGGVLDEYEDLTWAEADGSFDFELEMVPANAGLLVITADGYLPLRAPLSDYAPTDKGWSEYELEIPMHPAGQDG